MSCPNLLAPALAACLLAAAFLGIAPVANAESGGQSSLKPGKISRNKVIKVKRRYRSVRIHLPIGPGSVYYDYPYYYSRGYYPTHIGGYVYYPYNYYRRYYPRRRDRCFNGHRRCVAKSGYRRGSGSPRRQRARRN